MPMIQFVSHFLFLIVAISSVNTSKPELSIQPKGVGYDQSHYIATIGSQLSLQCELNTTNINGVSLAIVKDGLQWWRGQHEVNTESLSVFTQSEIDPDGNWVRKTLVVPQVNDNSAGTYRCVYLALADHDRYVHIHLIDKINWHLKSERIGAQIGTPLTIDCGTDGQPNVTVKIMDHQGRAIEESPILDIVGGKIYVTGHEMTIEKLGRNHQGMKIRCFAIRTVPLDDQNSELTIHTTDERNLTIEVWEAPRFAELERHFYKQHGSTAVLFWRVVASNPPVLNFTIKKDGKMIGNGGEEGGRHKLKYQISEGVATALLNISKVNDDDFGQYTCTAHNGKLSTDQSFFLDKPNPPNQPLVRPLQVTNNSIQWHVEEQTKTGQLPVSYFRIDYKPIKRRVQTLQTEGEPQKESMENEMATTDDEDEGGKYWRQRTTDTADRQKGAEGKATAARDGDWEELKQNSSVMTAIIGGLQPFTVYEFTFTAFNEAGSSDPVTTKQETTDDWVPAHGLHNNGQSNENTDASSSSVSTYVSIGLVGILVLLSFIIAAAYCFADCGAGNVPPSDGKCISSAAPVP